MEEYLKKKPTKNKTKNTSNECNKTANKTGTNETGSTSNKDVSKTAVDIKDQMESKIKESIEKKK
jgi:hypothetical protein